MAKYQKGDEKSAIPMFLAALIVIAVAIGSFVFKSTDTEDPLGFVVTEENGVVMVNPGEGLLPFGPPNVAVPDNPPL